MPNQPGHIYVNSWQLSLQQGEIIVRFGEVINQTEEAQVAREAVGLVMTHQNFAAFAKVVKRIDRVLTLAYNGELPKALEITDELAGQIASGTLED
jgi:hypothetical protein